MREIKFRGLVRAIGMEPKWVYGNLSILKEQHESIEAGYYISNSVGLPFAYKVDPETIGQYSGLRNERVDNRELYEGDILEYDTGGDGRNFRLEVRFHQGIFYAWDNDAKGSVPIGTLPLCEYVNSPVEWVGTVHENPELLRGG